jgi:C4-dicarboxylate-specific signal transduction histidine kinase
MSQEELEKKIAELEEEISSLKHKESLLAGRTALAWVNMTSSTWRHAVDKYAVTIRDQVELLRRDLLFKDDFGRINDRLTKIEQLANQIRQKPITPPLSSEEGLAIVDVTALIRERISQYRFDESYSNVEMVLQAADDEVLVRISPEWFRRGLDMIVDNSVEAMTSSQIKRLVIKVLEFDSQTHIVIEDTGCGVPDDVIPLLFKKPISQNRSGKGLGLGLLMAQMIFQTYGGDLQLTHTNPHGSTFTISLPQAS